MSIYKLGFGLAVVWLVFANTQPIAAQPFISNTFSLGYGFTGPYSVPVSDPPSWNTNETSGTNTAITGAFTLTPTFSATSGTGNFSTGGPVFANRVLASDIGAEQSSNASTFAVSIEGSYTGTALPGHRTRLEIDGIGAWVGDMATDGGSHVGPNWEETTVGHTGSSSSFSLPAATTDGGYGSILSYANNYAYAVWDPGDFATQGETATRTFVMNVPLHASDHGMDGFEIYGRVIYEVPEPSTLLILGLGLVGLLGRRRHPVRGAVC